MVKFLKTEGGRVVSSGCWERGMGSCTLMGIKCQFCKMSSVLEVDGSDGCTTM